MRTFGERSGLTWTLHPDIEGVMVAEAKKEGPTVMLMGGVHPDEESGPKVVRSLRDELSFHAGRVVAVLGNLEAMKTRTRGTAKADGSGLNNLNRQFRKMTASEMLLSPQELPYEISRGHDLTELIDSEGDALETIYDMHEGEHPRTPQFIITERNALETVRRIGPVAVVFGFADVEPDGSDGYAYRNGIEGICHEVGPMHGVSDEQNVRIAKAAILRILAAKRMVSSKPRPLCDDPLLVQVGGSYTRQGEPFEMTYFDPFEIVRKGTRVLSDGGVDLIAEEDFSIVFPKVNAPDIGREVFEYGEIVSN